MEIMMNDEEDELFKWLKKMYKNNLEKMKSSDFIFNCVHLLYFKCPKSH